MIEVRNSAGKKICCIDKENKTVEIAVKGQITHIIFLPNGEVKISNK